MKKTLPALRANLDEASASPCSQPFVRKGDYVDIYDLVGQLPIYRGAQEKHLEWIRKIAQPAPIVIDAGGGTGNTVLAGQRVRSDASFYLIDQSPTMVEQAIAKGVERSRVSLSSVTNMRLGESAFPSASAHHIVCHSVLWALPNPAEFFQECARVMKPHGTLAVSTLRRVEAHEASSFVAYLRRQLGGAVANGLIPEAAADQFAEANAQLLAAAPSPLRLRELIRLGDAGGFDLLESLPAYVVPSENGARAIFHQVLFRKRGKESPLEFGIREAQAEDAMSLMGFVQAIREEFGLGLDREETDQDLELFASTYAPKEKEGNFFFVAKDTNGAIVGSCALFRLPDSRAELRKLYVAPEARGKGLGRRLVAAAIAIARDEGVCRIDLETCDVLVHARALYQSLGFRPSESAVESGMADVRLSLQLD